MRPRRDVGTIVSGRSVGVRISMYCTRSRSTCFGDHYGDFGTVGCGDNASRAALGFVKISGAEGCAGVIRNLAVFLTTAVRTWSEADRADGVSGRSLFAVTTVRRRSAPGSTPRVAPCALAGDRVEDRGYASRKVVGATTPLARSRDRGSLSLYAGHVGILVGAGDLWPRIRDWLAPRSGHWGMSPGGARGAVQPASPTKYRSSPGRNSLWRRIGLRL